VPDGSPPVENVGTVTSAGNARAVTPADVSSARARSLLSPAVKRLIAELAVDPSAIRGTGAGGRLTVDDVLRYASERRTERATGEAGNPAGRRIPHSPTRRRIAEHMVRSLLHTAPHVTTVFEADYAAVLAHRARNREALASRGTTLTLTAYIVAACVDAIRAVPEANARWTDDALEIVDSIDIGVAAAVEGKGLIVPVVHDAPALDVAGVASELGRLAALARSDRLTPADVRGGTFTVSNHGVSGSLIAAPIVINQPQVAILGVGKVESRPVVIEDAEGQRIAARPRGYLTLTIDHRVMDGHRANRFLEVLVDRLERWPLE
jgi:2-oxoglutarate dehydrogenase E2 component (dihydrolipoamide succinyltransferase)